MVAPLNMKPFRKKATLAWVGGAAAVASYFLVRHFSSQQQGSVSCSRVTDGVDAVLDCSKFYRVLKQVSHLVHDVSVGKQAFEERARKNPRDAVGRLLAILWPKFSGGTEETAGRNAIVCLCVLGLCKVWILHRSAGLVSEITAASHSGNLKALGVTVFRSFWVLLLAAPLTTLFEYHRDSLSIAWRNKLTLIIHEEYFNLMNYYSIANLQGRSAVVDPEERLAREVMSVCRRLSSIISLLFKSIPSLFFFTVRLWRQKGWRYAVIPLLYFVCAYEVAQRLFPKNIGTLYREQARAVGSYFSSVTRVQTHGEAIAALGGANLERAIVESKFASVAEAKRSVHRALTKFQVIFKLAYTYGSRTWIGSMVMWPLLTRSSRASVAEEVSELRVVRQIMINMLIANGDMLTLYATAEHMAGSAYRIVNLIDTLRTLTECERDQKSAVLHAGDRIVFENVQVFTPTNIHLVKDLSFEVNRRESLLLTGHNGAGKSSIFRCLGGLWSAQGKITKPSLAKDVFYLPQKPYNVLGTLADQLTYPLNANETQISEKETASLLELVELSHLFQEYGGCTNVVNWEDKLSLGEQQRLAIARLFYHKPAFAVLDECTSAVPHAMEELLYTECQRLGIAYITICHRPALKKYHEKNLNLTGDGKGGWELQALNKQGEFPKERGQKERKREMTDIDRWLEERSACYSHMRHIPSVPQRSALSRLKKLLGLVIPGSGVKLAALLSAVVLRTLVHEGHSFLTGSMYSAVIARNRPLFVKLACFSYAVDIASAFVEEGVVLLQNEVAVLWNETLTRTMLDKFFRDAAFYSAQSLDKRISDPDQRITQELQEAAESLASIWANSISPIVDIGFFSFRLQNSLGWSGLTPLIAYLSSTWLLTSFALPDYKLINTRERELESQFRFIHTRIRNHAESIAFFGGGSREKQIADSAIRELVSHQWLKVYSNAIYRLLYLVINKDYSVVSGSLSTPDIVTSVLQTLFATKHQDGSQVAQGNFYIATATDRTLTAFGKLTNLYECINDLLGSASRIVEMIDVFDDMFQSGTYSDARLHGDATVNAISLSSVDIVTPAGKCLAADLSLTVSPQQSLMVTGMTRSGKTSFFRVVAGLWPIHGENASLSRPPRKQLVLLPQKPYCVSGTLRDQVLYPDSKTDCYGGDGDSSIVDALNAAGIGYLADRKGGLDATARWEDTLSLGEQQRMGLARLFYHHPLFAVIDEATDAVSVDQEEKLYEVMNQLGITCITISKRLNLPQFHEQKLTFGIASPRGYSLHLLHPNNRETEQPC